MSRAVFSTTAARDWSADLRCIPDLCKTDTELAYFQPSISKRASIHNVVPRKGCGNGQWPFPQHVCLNCRARLYDRRESVHAPQRVVQRIGLKTEGQVIRSGFSQRRNVARNLVAVARSTAACSRSRSLSIRRRCTNRPSTTAKRRPGDLPASAACLRITSIGLARSDRASPSDSVDCSQSDTTHPRAGLLDVAQAGFRRRSISAGAVSGPVAGGI